MVKTSFNVKSHYGHENNREFNKYTSANNQLTFIPSSSSASKIFSFLDFFFFFFWFKKFKSSRSSDVSGKIKIKSNKPHFQDNVLHFNKHSVCKEHFLYYFIVDCICEQGTFKTGLCNTEKHVTYYIYCHNSDFYQDFETIFPRFTFKNAFRCLWFRIWNISKGNRLEQTKNTNISIHKEIHMQT